ncbi:type I site-specific restriction-modification system, restriction subunit [Actinobacillus pleuropneumoniae]|nr:type I site-specific restriction-modification system, restriction subunit [Actinobacillus pleuropneumoniae]
MHINENTIEQACIQALQGWGGAYTFGSEIERERAEEVVLKSVLANAITRLNPQLPSNVVNDVVALVCKGDITDLTERNQQFYRLLREGVRVEYRENDEQKIDIVRLIDFQNVHNNQFDVVNKFTIKGLKGNRRPDVICFVNGLPLVVFELKIRLQNQPICNRHFNSSKPIKQKLAISLFSIKPL